jgi:hypothetical protein
VRSERILPPADRGELLEIPSRSPSPARSASSSTCSARLDNAPKILPVQELKIRVVNLTQPKDLLVTLTSRDSPPGQRRARPRADAEPLLVVNVVLAGISLLCVGLS